MWLFLTSIITIYKSQIHPSLDYCSHVWGGAPKSALHLLEKIQSKAILINNPNLTNSLQSLSPIIVLLQIFTFYCSFHGHCSLVPIFSYFIRQNADKVLHKLLRNLHTLKLKGELEKNPPNADKNADIYAELIQLLDDRSLALIMRDAKDNGKKTLEILREHYMGQGKPKIIALYTELTTLNKGTDESTTDYLIRAEAAAAALKNSGETVGDSLLIAMILKGLPSNFNTFKTVTTQKDPQQSFQQFKVSLRAFEESEHSSVKAESVMKVEAPGMSKRSHQITCYFCKKIGHNAYECKQNKRWCIICKSKSHDTKVCRKKGDTVSNFLQEEEPKVNYYFKVGVEPNVEISCNDNVNLLVDCGATTHIVNDLAQFICFDKNFNPDEHYIELADGSRSNNIALKKGMAKVTLQGTNGKAYNIGLENCLYIPSYKQNIFSVHAATEKGASVEFSNNAGSLSTKDGTKFEIKKEAGCTTSKNVK